MNRTELATLLNGRKSGNEITKAEAAKAKAAGLLVAYVTDGSMLLHGLIDAKFALGVGVSARISKGGTLVQEFDDVDKSDEQALEAYFAAIHHGFVDVEPLSDYGPGPLWTLKTAAPHSAFEIVKDGAAYCCGVVIDKADL